MVGVAKPVSVDFSNLIGGMNTAFPDVSLAPNQCQRLLNLMATNIGAMRVSGFLGLKSTAMFGAALKGLQVYEKLDGTEILLSVSNAKLSVIDVSNGNLSDIYTSASGQSEAWFANALDKCFICDGKANYKAESSSVAYKIGIAPPTGVAAAAAAGGSLPDGVYKIFAGYARRVSSVNVLYSTGQSISDVTLGGGNNTIAITSFANSADTQVGDKVIWMTDNDGAIYYLYHSTGNNTTTSFNITDTTGKNAALLYTVVAAPNYVPDPFTFIYHFDRRIWGVISNRVYYSLKSATVYDLEKFDTANNFIDFPHTIISLFELSGHLYVNTVGGLFRQPAGDVSAKYELVDSRYFFKYPRTVDFYMGQVIGVTNDGVRTFNGENFSEFDYSKNIKPEIDNLYAYASTTFNPCGKVVRRNFRTEYHLSFRDSNYGTLSHSRHLVLNLTNTTVQDANTYQTPWEEWKIGVSHIVNTKANVLYYGQTLAASGTVFKEQIQTVDQYVYNQAAVFLSAATVKYAYLKTRLALSDLAASTRWKLARFYAQIAASCSFRVTIGDNPDAVYEGSISVAQAATNALQWDVTNWDATFWAIANATGYKSALPWTIKGKGVYLEIWQSANDPTFKLLRTQLDGEITRSRFS